MTVGHQTEVLMDTKLSTKAGTVQGCFLEFHPFRCSADPSLLSEITYADDRILAHVKSYVFSFIDIPSLLFSCKLSLCLREKDGCEGVSVNLKQHLHISQTLI